MRELKHIICRKRNIVRFVLLEVIVIAIYSLIAVTTFSAEELLYEENDMQLKNHDGIVDGNYLDTSYADTEAVVTPAFQLQRGIYYIEASYARHGIVRAGLIYDIDRNGKTLVDNDEFILSPDKQAISYRVKIHDDSKIRFKLRLTGDAVEGDYIQLLQVRVVASKLTYVYRIFQLISCLLVIDLIVWGYFRYYSRWDTERKMVSLVLIITTFFIGLPLYRSGLTNGVDLVFHLSRLDGIYQSLKFGGGGGTQFPVRIQSGWLDGYGYAVSVFYGDIFMYVPAMLRAVGFTLEEAYKAYLGIVNIATVFVSFYAFKKITRDDIPAMVGSVLYAGSIQRVTLMYTVVLGGVSGMVFYPLILAGFWLLFTEDVESEEYKRVWILLTLGFTGILMTHMISCLMIGMYSVLLCIVMLKRLLRKNTLIQLFKAAGMAVLLNLWYLVPFLQYMFREKLRINSKIAANTSIEDYYAALEDFAQEGKSLYHFFTDNDTLGYAILIVLLLYIATIPVQKKCKQTGRVRIFSLFTLFTIFVCTDLFPVVALARRSSLLTKFFRTIQYQYRLMSVVIVMAACLAALFFTMDIFERKKLYYIAGVLCCIMLWQNIQYFATLSFDAVYLDSIALESRTDKELYSYTVGNGEYLPVMFKTTELTEAVESEESLIMDQVRREGLSFEVSVRNLSSAEGEVLFPILYYGGYQARDLTSHEDLTTAIGDNGRVAVTVPPNYSGTFHVGFHEPLLWRIAEIISVITFIIMIVLMYRKGSVGNGDQVSYRFRISQIWKNRAGN